MLHIIHGIKSQIGKANWSELDWTHFFMLIPQDVNK